MQDITIRELIDLVTAQVSDSESRIQRVYEWHFEREMTICKWVIGGAVSLGIAFIVGLLKENSAIDFGTTIVVVTAIIFTAIYGFVRLHRVRAIHKQFIASLRLHAELSKAGSFLRKYRIRRV